MPQAYLDRRSNWAIAARQRRSALVQRTGVGVASALVVAPLLGWNVSLTWLVGYVLIQLIEAWTFEPITRQGREDMGRWRSLLGCSILFANTAFYGSLSIPLWLNGGPTGGVCAAIMLTAAAVYSMVNAPRSAIVLTCTMIPHAAYLALIPFFLNRWGADHAYVVAAGASAVVFMTFCLHTWQRMNNGMVAETRARLQAERERAEAERVAANRSGFLAAVAHDLRTPIGAILTGAAELEKGDAQARSTAALITDAGLMMKALLDDLLDHSKLDAGRMTVEAVPFDPRALLAQTLRLWQGPADAKGLKLRIEGSRALPQALVGDPMRLRQVLNNLISNAMKFTQDGAITVRLRSWPDETGRQALLIEVSDTGPGMTPEQMTRLFTPFDQLEDGVSARHGGSGLGLAISRHLAQLMGGRLLARSRPGEGAAFTLSLTLPRAEAAAPLGRGVSDEDRGAIARALSSAPVRREPLPVAPQPAASELEETIGEVFASETSERIESTPELAQVEAAADDTDEGRPLRVLVVDDHAINRRAIELILTPLGCETTAAADGLEALAIAQATAFDVIFMDVRMPELDGRETTRRLRAGGGPNADAPVIAVTADSQPEDIAACMAAGMTYFVSKPLTPPALLGALSHVLSGGSEDGEAAESAAA